VNRVSPPLHPHPHPNPNPVSTPLSHPTPPHSFTPTPLPHPLTPPLRPGCRRERRAPGCCQRGHRRARQGRSLPRGNPPALNPDPLPSRTLRPLVPLTPPVTRSPPSSPQPLTTPGRRRERRAPGRCQRGRRRA
jgi:hypothetical protein